jgi:putative ABC transport system permease protein
MKAGLYWRYATRSLRRGGQRTVLAIFCVAVGVMAIVALQLVGLSVNQALLSNIVEANGGDLRMRALPLVPLHQSDLQGFDNLKQQGLIADYATANEYGGVISLPSGQDVVFSLFAVSRNFPLVGQADFIAPSHDLRVQDVITGNTAIVSSDTYDQLHAHIDDHFHVKLRDGRVIPITIGGEYQDSGAFPPAEIIMSADAVNTAPGPNGAPLPVTYTTVFMTIPADHLNVVEQQLRQQYTTARFVTAQDLLRQRQTQVDDIRLFLHLVGLLALFIGGVGIINTMQVLLRRRSVEIAMLKSSGYRQRDLYALFGLEAALLGVIGGILGAAAGVGASYVVRIVMERAFFLHLPVILDPFTIASGLVIGLATALIFGLLPIIQASQVRPLAVLRETPEVGQISRLASVGLLGLLSLLFVGLATVIMGSVLTAVLAVYGGAIAIGALGLGFSLLIFGIARLPVYEHPRPRMILWIMLAIGVVILGFVALGVLVAAGGVAVKAFGTIGIYVLVLLGGAGIILAGGSVVFFLATLVDSLVMFAPRVWKTAVMLAYRNIGRQRARTTATLTALFVGIFGIGMVLVMGQGIKDTIDTTLANALQYNVFVLVTPPQSSQVQATLGTVPGLDQQHVGVSTVGVVKPSQLGGVSGTALIQQLEQNDDLGAVSGIEGFDLTRGVPFVKLKAGRDLTTGDIGTNHVVVSSALEDAPFSLHLDDTFTVSSRDDKTVEPLTIVGFYDHASIDGNPNFGSVLSDQGVAIRLTGITRLSIFSLKIDPHDLPELRRNVNQSVPSAIVFSLVDISAIVDQILTNVIIMLTTLASLAMLAGLIIIANAVALAMLERRREIGILKSVGHSSNSILSMVLIENGLVGLLGALVAMLLVAGAIFALGAFALHITLQIPPNLVALIIGLTVLLTMTVAASVAWGATRVRPLEVLRYE